MPLMYEPTATTKISTPIFLSLSALGMVKCLLMFDWPSVISKITFLEKTRQPRNGKIPRHLSKRSSSECVVVFLFTWELSFFLWGPVCMLHRLYSKAMRLLKVVYTYDRVRFHSQNRNKRRVERYNLAKRAFWSRLQFRRFWSSETRLSESQREAKS